MVGVNRPEQRQIIAFSRPRAIRKLMLRIPVIAIMMFTMPEVGMGNGMTWCCELPLTVEQMSFLSGVRQVR